MQDTSIDVGQDVYPATESDDCFSDDRHGLRYIIFHVIYQPVALSPKPSFIMDWPEMSLYDDAVVLFLSNLSKCLNTCHPKCSSPKSVSVLGWEWGRSIAALLYHVTEAAGAAGEQYTSPRKPNASQRKLKGAVAISFRLKIHR